MKKIPSINSREFREFHQKRIDEKNYAMFKKWHVNEEKKKILEEKAKQKKIQEEIKQKFHCNWRDELVVPVPEEVVVEVQEPKVNKILKVNREKGGVVGEQFVQRVVSEAMTSGGMFQTTLPADNNLGGITANDYSLIAGASVDGSSAVLDSNNLPGSFGNAQVFTSFLDLSNIDTLQFNISKRSVGSSEELRLFWRTPDMVSGGDTNFYLLKNTFFSSQTVDVKNSISQYRDPSQIQFAIKSFYSGSTTPRNYTTWNINSATFQRRTPVNVFVSLDSPEATAFIRTDPVMQGLSADERRKKLEEMLESGNEYLLKALGLIGNKVEFADTGNIPSWEEAAGEQPEPSSPESSAETGKSKIPNLYQGKSAAWMTGAIGASSIESLTDQFRGTNVRVQFLKAQAQEAERASKTIAQLGRRSSSLSNEKQIQQAIDRRDNAMEMIKAEIEGSTPNLKPITQVPKISDDRVELEKNIEASLKQLDIDNEELKGEALKRNIAVAAEIGLDVLTLITLLSPIPGDEVAALSAQGVKVGSKATAKKALEKAVTKSNPSQRVKDFANRIHSSGLPGGQGTIYPGGTGPGSTPLRIYRNSYEPVGEVITEKKRLKSPKDLQNKIPGYYDGKPSPLGFPDNPPKEMVNGFHADLVTPEGQKKQSNRYNRMDQATAKAMPMTDNPYINKKIIKARLQPK